jgi:beta-glucosidase
MFDKKTFFWGAAVSAAQVESAHDIDGKGPSIWDEFCSRKKGIFFKKNRIANGDHLKDSSDFYTHYKTDIDNLAKIGFKHFRFSIAWSRVMPDGINPNPQGIQFYKDVIDYCIESDITPWITLYHWDLPLALEKKGGWTNRDILIWFRNYVEFCVKELNKVRHWMILNEPSVFLGAGYLFGLHAPGKKSFNSFFKATHHAMLSINEAYHAIKSIDPAAVVGSSFSLTHIEPASSSEKDILSARLADLMVNRFFMEPVLGMGYPVSELKKLSNIEKYIQTGDKEKLQTPLDFIGIQTYTREVFKYNPYNPYLKVKHIPASERSIDLTAMNWEMHPESIYQTIMKVHRYSPDTPIVVTENGVAFKDEVIFGRVNDFARIHYFQTHINEVMRARSDGAKVCGYFAWSLIDNFEWAEGFEPRFGLVYVDFKTKKRLLKESARWFMHFLKNDTEYLDEID